MDADAFRKKIAKWRLDVNMSQAELDEACGFRRGTVGEIELGDLNLTDEKLVSIMICTNRDLLWTLMEDFGSLFKRLQPLEASLRRRLGKEPLLLPPDEDEEFERGLASMLAGMEIVYRKQLRISNRRTLLTDALLEAAARVSPRAKPNRKRAEKPRKRRKKKPPEEG
jgi:transcriptional regulator with XRE-family HTH domain